MTCISTSGNKKDIYFFIFIAVPQKSLSCIWWYNCNRCYRYTKHYPSLVNTTHLYLFFYVNYYIFSVLLHPLKLWKISTHTANHYVNTFYGLHISRIVHYILLNVYDTKSVHRTARLFHGDALMSHRHSHRYHCELRGNLLETAVTRVSSTHRRQGWREE